MRRVVSATAFPEPPSYHHPPAETATQKDRLLLRVAILHERDRPLKTKLALIPGGNSPPLWAPIREETGISINQ